MTIQVVGAGLGRTGTTSLTTALEHLLGAPSYHMSEVMRRREHIPLWHDAVRGQEPSWDTIFDGYAATLDWPGAAFWESLHGAYPDALVLLSVRKSTDEWFRSVDGTINRLLVQPPEPGARAWHAMVVDLLRTTFTPVPFVERDAKAAYEAHNDRVREVVPADRLLVWQVDDGWEPLCERLGVDVPAEPFPHLNTARDFEALLSHDRAAAGPGGVGRRVWQRITGSARRGRA